MSMSAINQDVLVAPSRLLVSTRADFRASALRFVEQRTREGAEEIVFDLSNTMEIDASGIGLLVLLQEWAQRGGTPVRLMGVQRPVRDLLVLTRLDGLFLMS